MLFLNDHQPKTLKSEIINFGKIILPGGMISPKIQRQAFHWIVKNRYSQSQSQQPHYSDLFYNFLAEQIVFQEK